VSKPPKANRAMPSRLAVWKSVRTSANGQRITRPTAEIRRLMLNALLFLECIPTATTEKPEAAAESSANTMPSMQLPLVVAVLKEIPWSMRLFMGNSACFRE
jgi:hypothetical protein